MTVNQAIEPTEPDRPAISHLPEDTRHRLLADDCRRRALTVLDGIETPVSIEELARQVADDGPTPDGTGPQVDDGTVLSFHHVHLPMLAEAGVVAYDPETMTVETLD